MHSIILISDKYHLQLHLHFQDLLTKAVAKREKNGFKNN